MDFLGSRKNIKENANLLLRDILSLFITAKEELEKTSSDFPYGQIKHRIFSDNIIVSCELDDNLLNNKFRIGMILQFAASFQKGALRKGYLLRGGITIGKYFCNDVLVWGSALVEAVGLEEKVALYPRIIINQDVIDETRKTDYEQEKRKNQYDSIISSYCEMFYKEDIDKMVFLDYLRGTDKEEEKFCVPGTILYTGNELWISEIEDIISSIIINKESEKVPRIQQKLGWQINYLTQYLQEVKEREESFHRKSWSAIIDGTKKMKFRLSGMGLDDEFLKKIKDH